MYVSLRRHSPERSGDSLERPAWLVRLQVVMQHRDDVCTHVRIGNEIAVAEEVGCAEHLHDVDGTHVPTAVICSGVNIRASILPRRAMLPNSQLGIAIALSSGEI